MIITRENYNKLKRRYGLPEMTFVEGQNLSVEEKERLQYYLAMGYFNMINKGLGISVDPSGNREE